MRNCRNRKIEVDATAEDWHKKPSVKISDGSGVGPPMQFIHLAKVSLLLALSFWCSSPAFADKPVKCKNADECMAKGQNLIDGRGGKFDPDLGIPYLEAACAMDHGVACFAAGIAYERFLHVENRMDKKLVAFERACSLGVIEGCNNVVVHLSSLPGTDPAIYERANRTYAAMCDQEIGLGCGNLSVAYEQALGVEKDETIANELLLKACDLDACPFGAKKVFVPGAIRPLAVRRIERLQQRCLERGDVLSCEQASGAYQAGDGVEINPEKGLAIVSSACDRGHMEVCWKVGQNLMYGRGMEKNANEGLLLLKRACDAEVAYACGDAGRLLHEHPELAANPDEAQSYARLACDMGDSYTCEKVEEFARSDTQ